MENASAPQFNQTVFSCPHCHIVANQVWSPAYQKFKEFNPEYNHTMQTESKIPNVYVSKCILCKNEAIWYDGKIIFPISPEAPLPHMDMPENVKLDYLEARDIAEKSPRAAVALLRLALQKLLPYLGGEGKNINEDIKKLAGAGLDAHTIKSLDILRIVGNEAVHPGQIDLKDDHDMAMFAFTLLNLIVENQISHRQRVDNIHKQLPKNKILGIFNRDQKDKE